MATFVVNVSDLDEEGKDYTFELPGDWLASVLEPTGLRARAAGPVGQVEVHLQRNGKDLLLTGGVNVALVGACVRCLEDAAVAVRAPWTILLSEEKAARRGPAPVVLSSEELDRGTYSGDVLILDDVVSEHLLVECPMQPICRDDCKGLEVPAHIRPPADFGAEAKGVDPRLSPLLKLKDKVLPNKE